MEKILYQFNYFIDLFTPLKFKVIQNEKIYIVYISMFNKKECIYSKYFTNYNDAINYLKKKMKLIKSIIKHNKLLEDNERIHIDILNK